MLPIHHTIIEKLQYFHSVHKIPNIIFHGQSGSGKRTIVNKFISEIYNNDKEKIKSYVMNVNCAHGKGIKFIRDELKFFAKTNINSNGGDIFKSIILLNADKLTTDAQSALRRCIELFSHNTRFFIIIEDKYKLLKPILSRFCEIYIPEPIYKDKPINLYQYNINNAFKLNEIKVLRIENLIKELNKCNTLKFSMIDIMNLSSKLYEKGFNALDIVYLLENNKCFTINVEKKYELLIAFNKVRKEFRNEKLLILFLLHYIYLSSDIVLENISFI
jgi:DNA polymerase III delta prime subunit